MVMWPKTILPSAVAGPTAAKALQWSGLGADRRFLGLQEIAGSPIPSARRRGGVERHDFGPGVDRGHVDHVDFPAVKLGAGRAGAVGDAAHLFQIFLVITAEEQRIDDGGVSFQPSAGDLELCMAARQRISAAISGAMSRPCCTPRRTVRPRYAGRSSRPADNGRPGRSAGPSRIGLEVRRVRKAGAASSRESLEERKGVA